MKWSQPNGRRMGAAKKTATPASARIRPLHLKLGDRVAHKRIGWCHDFRGHNMWQFTTWEQGTVGAFRNGLVLVDTRYGYSRWVHRDTLYVLGNERRYWNVPVVPESIRV